MIHDDYERDIEATMDDLECLEFINEPQSTKPTKYQKPFLPEIDENSTLETQNNLQLANVGCTSMVLSNINRGPFRVPDMPTSKMRASLALPFQGRRKLSQCKEEENEDEIEKETIQNSLSSNDKTKTIANNGIGKINEIAGAKRKFIVTRMDSQHLLRPEAENLRNLTEKTNAATIHFPCTSSANQRSTLSSLFPSNSSFEPHLDKRFFDSSLVEVRVKTDSTQSLNTTLPEKKDFDSVWQRRKVPERSPAAQTTVSIFEGMKATCYSDDTTTLNFRFVAIITLFFCLSHFKGYCVVCVCVCDMFKRIIEFLIL